MDQTKIASPTPESRLHFLDYWRIIRVRKTVILAVFLLVVITATLVTFILPEQFMSTTTIRVANDESDIQGVEQRQFRPQVYDPYFIATEFEVIKSRLILEAVISELKLGEKWAAKYNVPKLLPDETFLLLSGKVDLRPVRNTSLIEIRVFSDNAEEAAVIANSIAKVYKEYRQKQRKDMTLGGIRTLQEQFDEQEEKVRKMAEELDAKRSELKISETEAAGDGPSPVLETEVLRRIEAQRIEAEARAVAREELLSQLKPLSHKERRKILPTAYPDNLLVSLLEQWSLAEQRLVALGKDYGPEHSDVQRVKAQVDDLNTKIEDRVDGIIKGLETQVATARAEIDKLRSMVEDARKADLEKAEKSRPYFEMKRKLAEMMRFRNALQMRILAENTDLQLPKTSMAEIITQATPGLKAVRPNKPLNIALGVIVGLVVGIGLAFFIEYLDTSVKTIDDVERALQAPVLGIIPQNVGLILYEGTESPHGEAYRVLRTNLLFSRKDDKMNAVCVVSAGAGEGKTTTAVNLATVFAQSGQRVIIVDSDLRRPTLHKLMRVGNNVGLTTYLLKQTNLEGSIQTTSLPNLDFMASGKLPSSSLGILSSPQMKELVNELKARYDFVFFDSPPIMGVSDASILASEVDLTLQVIQYRRYPQPMNIRAKQMIEKVGGTLVGIVLNNINMSQDESYYYYSGYYHDYYYAKKEEEPAAPADKSAQSPAEAEAAPKPALEIKQKY